MVYNCDMCGIIGIVDNNSVNQSLFDGLTVLQHRGQDSAGIATCFKNNLYQKKSKGLVNDIFSTKDMLELKGNLGIGHVRYPTAGSHGTDEAQPFYVNSPYGIALAHNGNLDNSELLREELLVNDRRHIHTQSDTEVLLNIFAHELLNADSSSFTVPDLFNAINGVHKRCSGAYAVVALIAGYGLVAFRDIHGIRPLILGRKKNSIGYSYIVSSESVALELLGYETVRDLEPGESTTVDFGVTPSHLQLVDRATGDRVCTPGVFDVEFTNGGEQTVEHQIKLEGPEVVLEGFPRY